MVDWLLGAMRVCGNTEENTIIVQGCMLVSAGKIDYGCVWGWGWSAHVWLRNSKCLKRWGGGVSEVSKGNRAGVGRYSMLTSNFTPSLASKTCDFSVMIIVPFFKCIARFEDYRKYVEHNIGKTTQQGGHTLGLRSLRSLRLRTSNCC